MEKRLDGLKTSWATPDNASRTTFLKKMEELALRVKPAPSVSTVTTETVETIGSDEENLKMLMETKEYSSAFFLARRLVTNGEAWAQEYLDAAQTKLTGSTN